MARQRKGQTLKVPPAINFKTVNMLRVIDTRKFSGTWFCRYRRNEIGAWKACLLPARFSCLEYPVRATLFYLIGTTIILGAIIGFGEAVFWRLAGQIVHGALSIACFTLVGAAFWRFGWKIGLLDLLLVFIASHVGLRLHEYLRKGSGL
ncbi:MAG: hypothetical protein DME48_01175 [Verrucomicrobia bacterium]|nr:MAG: hypothetical protein DME48_01175 [Verrucomicrobiota bacterium]